MLKIGTRVKIVDDVGKPDSTLLGKTGTIIGFKWNKFRQEENLPVVKLDAPVLKCNICKDIILQSSITHFKFFHTDYYERTANISELTTVIETVSGWSLWYEVLGRS